MKNKRLSFLILVFFFVLFFSPASAAETLISTDTAWLEQVVSPGAYHHVRDGDASKILSEDYLNRYRSLLGVPNLKTSESLRESAKNHADYLAENGTFNGDPHGEDSSAAGFTGATPDDRCKNIGYDDYCTEVQAHGDGDLYSALDGLMMTPFHRLALVHPGVKEIGCAQSDSWVVCDIGLEISDYWAALGEMDDPIIYPADGQVISTTFLVTESPMPYPAYTGKFIGPTLMYWPAGGVVAPEAEVSLYDLTNKEFIQAVLTIDTDNINASDAVFFNPTDPLELDHEYAVYIRDVSGQTAFEKVWTFKTQKSSNIDFPNVDEIITYDSHVDWVDPAGAECLVSTPNPEVESLIDRLRGYIMLIVDYYGEAWYVDPLSRLRFYLKDGPTAYEFLRTFGLGITNDDLAKIPVEGDANGGGELAERLTGRILLQVEEHGEAWYVNPSDLKRYYMADGNEAYRLMRELSLGTMIAWISEIPVGLVE